RSSLSGLRSLPTSTPLVSTVEGRAVRGDELGPEHWVRNVCEPVLFSPAIDVLVDAGHRLFLEIGATPLLSHPITDQLAARGQNGLVLSSLKRDAGQHDQMAR